ncbi:hypothetical protein D9M68_624260 [compost metagenome]
MAGELARLDVSVVQGALQQAVRPIQQAEQQIFHQHLAAAPNDAVLSSGFQVPAAVGVQCPNQLLQVNVDHLLSLLNLASDGDQTISALLAEPGRPAEAAGAALSKMEFMNVFVSQFQA